MIKFEGCFLQKYDNVLFFFIGISNLLRTVVVFMKELNKKAWEFCPFEKESKNSDKANKAHHRIVIYFVVEIIFGNFLS